MLQQRKTVYTVTVLYTIFILYFMFFAFGRIDTIQRTTGYTFLFLPDSFYKLPGLSDMLHPALMDLVGFGNIAAFIPFGILIPLLYRTSFIRFIAIFFLTILALETIQALTLLGSFDMNDAIQNTIGAAVGFGAYKLGFSSKKWRRSIAVTGVSAVVLLLGVWGLCEGVDKALTKEAGPFVSINQMQDSTGNMTTGTKRDSFEVGGQIVEPQYNAYSVEGKSVQTYTYALGGKALILSMYYGAPDQAELHGSISVSVDGHEYMSPSPEYERHEPYIFEVPLEKADKLTITIEGNEKVWDVGFRRLQYFWSA